MSDNNKKSSWQQWKENLGDSRPWHLITQDPVDEDTEEKRYNICLLCPELIKSTKQCKKCGCFMKAKTKIKSSRCPIGKW